MPYMKAQFIGYQIDTFPVKDTSTGNKYGKKYLGNANGTRDIKGRCNIMTDVIQLAKNKGGIDTNPGTLKIFMAPEFYFRGIHGAYPVESLSLILEEMRKITKAAAYKDWLFILGTALGYLEDGTDDLGDHKEVFNVALVQKGGKAEAERGSSLIVYKEHVSHIDFIRNPLTLPCKCGRRVQVPWELTTARWGLIGPTTGLMPVLRPTLGSRDVMTRREESTGEGREASKSGLGGQGYFVIDGITFGLEVCLDHARKRLRASPPVQGQNHAQIHLIPSAGMTIERDAVACSNNGLIFNVDGGGASAHAHLLKNTGTYDEPELSPGPPPDTIAPATSLNITQGLRGTDVKQYFSGPGMLHVFPAQNIPSAVPAPPKGP